MPTFSDDELRQAIFDGNIRGISLDSNIFQQLGNNLRLSILQKLDQFKDTGITVLFSEIVAREVTKHIRLKAEDTENKLVSSLKNYQKHWHSEFDIDKAQETLGLNGDATKMASDYFSSYIEAVGAIIVPVTGSVDIGELVNRYFETNPPFENNAKKKAEFPDAMALLSLESWAKQSGGLLIVVSDDVGWHEFSDKSDHLVCIKSVEIALDHLNDSGRTVANQAFAFLRTGAAEDLISEINTIIQARLDDNDFSIEADSQFSLEWEDEFASIQDWNVSEFTQPRIIASDDETVTFAIDLSCLIEFCAVFHFSVYDSIDRDYVNLGTEEVSKENRVELTLVLTINRDLDPAPQFVDASITTQKIEANFGYIEPNWGPDD